MEWFFGCIRITWRLYTYMVCVNRYLCVYMYAHMHVYMHTYMHTYAHTHMYTYVHHTLAHAYVHRMHAVLETDLCHLRRGPDINVI